MPPLTVTELGRRWVDSCEGMFRKGLVASEGRMLLRKGAVLDMKTVGPRTTASVTDVGGTYRVRIDIDVSDGTSVSALMGGLGNDLITGVGRSDEIRMMLIPSLDQIHCRCDCGNGDQCRHVASVLFAIGRLLDSDPELLLRIRGIGTDTILKNVLDDRLARMMENARKHSERAIPDEEARKLFGI